MLSFIKKLQEREKERLKAPQKHGRGLNRVPAHTCPALINYAIDAITKRETEKECVIRENRR